nr:hypothetical protein [Tanacetum cinerariifolium]
MANSILVHFGMLGRWRDELWNSITEKFCKKPSGWKGARPIRSSWFEGIQTRCLRPGVRGRDIIHLIAWEKAFQSFKLEAWAGALIYPYNYGNPWRDELWNSITEKFYKKLSGWKGARLIRSSWFEGIQTRCLRPGVRGRDIIHLIADPPSSLRSNLSIQLWEPVSKELRTSVAGRKVRSHLPPIASYETEKKRVHISPRKKQIEQRPPLFVRSSRSSTPTKHTTPCSSLSALAGESLRMNVGIDRGIKTSSTGRERIGESVTKMKAEETKQGGDSKTTNTTISLKCLGKTPCTTRIEDALLVRKHNRLACGANGDLCLQEGKQKRPSSKDFLKVEP